MQLKADHIELYHGNIKMGLRRMRVVELRVGNIEIGSAKDASCGVANCKLRVASWKHTFVVEMKNIYCV